MPGVQYIAEKRGLFRAGKKVKRVRPFIDRRRETRNNYATIATRMTIPDPEAQVTLQRRVVGNAMHVSNILRDDTEGGSTSRREVLKPGSITQRQSATSVLGYHGGIQRDVAILRTLPASHYKR
jgi:hypothetical protein